MTSAASGSLVRLRVLDRFGGCVWPVRAATMNSRHANNEYDVIALGGGAPGEHAAGPLATGASEWRSSSVSGRPSRRLKLGLPVASRACRTNNE